MELAIFTFFTVFVLITSSGLLLFYREAKHQNISSVITEGTGQEGLLHTLHQAGASLSHVVEHFERVLPKSQAEVSQVQKRLVRAGYRKDSAIKIYYGAKVVLPLFLAILTLVLLIGFVHQSSLFIYILTLGLGFIAPDCFLRLLISKRQKRIGLSLPDALDMLVICVEAGLSLDHAMVRTAKELDKAHSEISDELGMVILEQRAGILRSDAWKNLVDRTGVENIRNLVSVMVQSEQFGTSIAKTLRVHSDTLRTKRIQNLQEQAAKTSIKMIFPLVIFIFPSLFLVTLGPALIRMSDSFRNLISN
jgi:tight adherence protein C